LHVNELSVRSSRSGSSNSSGIEGWDITRVSDI
jgi:hypothetical protein